MNADACQVCPDPPFDRPACPATAIQAAPFGTLTAHACPSCGSSWRLFSDTAGFPVARRLDPVTPVQGGINLLALDLALDGPCGAPRRGDVAA